MKKLHMKNILGSIFLLAVISLFIGLAFYNKASQKQAVSYNEFLEKARNGEVESVTLTDGPKIQFKLAGGSRIYETDNPRNPLLKENLLTMDIPVLEGSYVSAAYILQSALSLLFLIVVFIVAFRMTGKSSGRSMMSLQVEQAETNPAKSVTFDNVAGNEEAKQGVADIVDFIKNPGKYSDYGARMPRGVIFYGPPGTGKTLMAKAIAGEADVPFYAVSGSDFVQMYVGVGASRVRDLFKKAGQSGKAVIFIDEIDAIGKKRGLLGSGGNDERDQTLNALLTEMSGFSSNEGIIVIAATNRIDTLDEALLRPGRFDRQVEIGLPDLNARMQILKLHLKNKPVSEHIDIHSLAKQTVFFSGAMLENLLNEAAIFAAKDGSGTIGLRHIDNAYYTVLAGSAKSDRSNITEREREITAFHESGHALSAKLKSPENTVSKITIIPSTKGAGGFCVNIAPDKMYYTKKELEAQAIISLAGRAAEELIFGEDNITTGASNDLEKAGAIVKDYVSKYGMSKTAGLAPLPETKLYEECASVIAALYDEAKKLLADNIQILRNIAGALLEKESLNEAELNCIIGC